MNYIPTLFLQEGKIDLAVFSGRGNIFAVMKAATIHDLKQELNTLQPAQLVELCTRLARFKKENKELLTYLLFEAHDEHGYIENVKKEIAFQFESLPGPNLHLTKKSIRKILRIANKHIRYTGSDQAEAELLICFCKEIKKSKIPIHKSPALTNIYNRQLEKINKAIKLMHEDLQYDYVKIVSSELELIS